jgi:DNA polymerase III epsilon subunit-like protein
MRVIDQEQISLTIKVRNPNSFSPEALEIQGILPDDLLKGVPIEDAIETIETFLNEDGKTAAHRCIIAHNAPFDRKFIHRAWDSCNKDFPADLWMCTMAFAKAYVKQFGGEKVAKAQLDKGVNVTQDKFGNLKPKFGLNNFLLGVGLQPKDGAHHAEIDVQNTKVLHDWLMASKTPHVSVINRIPHKDKPPTSSLDISDY